MIVSNEFVKRNISEIERNLHEYLVMRNPYSFRNDVEYFSLGIHITNLCNTLRIYNDFCEEIKFNNKIDFSILSKALLAIYKKKPFTLAELKEYIAFDNDLDKLGRAMNNLSTDLAESVFNESRTEVLLLGFSWEKQENLRGYNMAVWEKLVYHTLSDMKKEVFKGERTVENYQKEALSLLESALQKEEENEKIQKKGEIEKSSTIQIK